MNARILKTSLIWSIITAISITIYNWHLSTFLYSISNQDLRHAIIRAIPLVLIAIYSTLTYRKINNGMNTLTSVLFILLFATFISSLITLFDKLLFMYLNITYPLTAILTNIGKHTSYSFIIIIPILLVVSITPCKFFNNK
jgi:hypothetical protein